MAGNYTRLRFDALNDVSGLFQQQGRVMLDQDWNELVEVIDRRRRAETIDTIGKGVVPKQTPHGFEIKVTAGNGLSIGAGRIYVDGMLAENHGANLQFDPALEEMAGADPIDFTAQKYIPNPWPFGGTNPFAVPTAAGPHLVYLDVWKREVTYLQASDLVDKAVGLDTTTRLQTVWQVKVLPSIPAGSTCASTLTDWDTITARSAGQLTTAAAGVPASTDPCTIPPNTGYRGADNRTYRVEIHTAGGFGTAQFKWSRNNASMATQVTGINATANVLTVVRTKRDSVLRFTPGSWVEVSDDFHELAGLPGELHQIVAVDDVKLTITLKSALNAAQYNIANPTQRNTRVVLWDEVGTVRDINNAIVVDVDQNGGLIPVKQNTTIVLEDGIQVTFSLDPAITSNPQFHAGDHWIFAARAVDASVEILTKAAPRGIHHHYCRLAVVSFPGTPTDCRTFWPPDFGGGDGCECAVCVNAEDHNSGKFTIQDGINQAQSKGGGSVCLGPGLFQLRDTIKIAGATALQLVGHGQTVLVAPQGAQNATVPAILVDVSNSIILHEFALVLAPGARTAMANQMVTVLTPGIMIQNSAGVTVEDCAFFAFGNQLPENPAIGLGGFVMQIAARRNSFAFWIPDAQNNLVVGPGTGVGHLPTVADKPAPILLTLDLYVEDNFMQCGSSGINLDALCYHAWQVGISDNFIGPAAVAGIAVAGMGIPAPASRIEITGNEIVVSSASLDPSSFVSVGTGIICGVSAARITNNDVLPQGASGDGILLDVPLLATAVDGCQIIGNRIAGVGGIGIEIRAPLGSAMIKQNTIQNTGAGGIIMTGTYGALSSARHLSIANNQLLGLVPSVSNAMVGLLQNALGIGLVNVAIGEIEDNVIRDLGMDPTGSTPRIGISVAVCASMRISGNQLINIGPLDLTFGPSAAIAVFGPPFDRAEISGNVIHRSDRGTTGANSGTFWHALYIGPLTQFGANHKLHIVQLASGRYVLLDEGAVKFVAEGEQLTTIRGNVMEGLSASSVVEVTSTGSCVFTDNQCNLLTFGASRPPLAILNAPIVAAANNVILGPGSSWIPGGHALNIGATWPTVLGNITISPIFLNNAALPAPWDPLNVHINPF
jgi:hypothetical protein